MAIRQTQESEDWLGEMIEDTDSKGPQIIRRHGTEGVLPTAEYSSAIAHKCNLIPYLPGGPKVDSFEITRDYDTSAIR